MMNNLKIALYEGQTLIQERSVDPDNKLRIGRLDENELVLSHPNVSRYQCVVTFDGKQWVMEDLNSMNGFTVEGERKQSHGLKLGDEISIVPFRLVVTEAPGDDRIPAEEATLAVPLSKRDNPEEETAMSPIPDFDETGYGAGSEDMTYVGGSLSRYTVSIQNGPLKGTSVALKNTLLIGRENGCDLVLDDISVSRKHVQISSGQEGVTFRNISDVNVVKLNDKICGSGLLKNGDTLQVGDTRLKFKDTESSGVVTGFIHNKNVRIGVGLFLLVFFIGVILFNGGENSDKDLQVGSEGENSSTVASDQNKGKAGNTTLSKEELKKEREYQLYYEDGLKFAESGAYQAAVARFKMCLQIKPGDQQAAKQLKDIERKYEEQTLAKEQARKTQQKAIAEATALLERAGSEAGEQDYSAALDLINQALSYENTLDSDEVLLQQARDLRDKVSQSQQAYLNQKRQAEQNLETQHENVRKAYVAGNEAVMNGDFVRARQQWQIAAESKLDLKEKQQAIAELEKLDVFLAEKSEADFQKGMQAKRKNNYAEALIHLQKVVKLSPNHAQAVKVYDELMAIQVQQAQRAYQKGLVYEGINNLEKANLNWKRVLDLLPLKDSEYYIKAQRKLAEHSH